MFPSLKFKVKTEMDTVLCVDYYSLLAIMIPHTRSVFVSDVDATYPQSGSSWLDNVRFSHVVRLYIDYTSNI